MSVVSHRVYTIFDNFFPPPDILTFFIHSYVPSDFDGALKCALAVAQHFTASSLCDEPLAARCLLMAAGL